MKLIQIGVIRSSLKSLDDAPRQGDEGAPNAWLEISAEFVDGLRGIALNEELVLITWLHLASRDVLQTHPRNDPSLPMTGVFLTRSPDRPNPLGLHRVRVLAIDGARIQVGPLEALDGTPVVDIKIAWSAATPVAAV
jgi:tRNA-Thr(GGU) m(6)t(6)A37 methyltransferase TsaA